MRKSRREDSPQSHREHREEKEEEGKEATASKLLLTMGDPLLPSSFLFLLFSVLW